MVTGGLTLSGFITRATEIFNPGSNSWTRVGDLGPARYDHSATLLPSGLVLAAGGSGTQTAELFDPGSGNWSPTGSLPEVRFQHSATLLPSGLVLVAAGRNAGPLGTAQLYDPTNGTWSPAPPLAFARYTHAATMLPDGRVLIAGGYYSSPLVTAELYDADAPAWAPANSMAGSRSEATATQLKDGRVLVAGGSDQAEVYDPTSGGWSPTGNALSVRRYRHTATLLVDGRVLAVGTATSIVEGATADIYDPATNLWTPAGSMSASRYWHTATLLPCGEVLVAGGFQDLATAERYNPRTGRWRATSSMKIGRYGHTATLLRDGRVLVTGGWNAGSPSAEAEVYDPTGETWTVLASTMTVGRYHHRSTLLPSGKVLLTAGSFASGTADLFDPAVDSFTATGPMTGAHSDRFTTTLLPNGRVLVVGGFPSPSTAEGYDPAVGVWTVLPNTLEPRDGHVAALLPDGRVLVAGGGTSSAEIFDVGRGEAAGWRPTLTIATDPLVTGTPLAVTGVSLRGLGEGSTGLGFMHSATNYPLVQLRRLDNDLVAWLPVDPASRWSDIDFTSVPVSAVPPGLAAATVFTNGIPSVSRVITVECPPPAITGQPSDQLVCLGGTGGFTAIATTGDGCPTYQWRKGGVPLSDGGSISGSATPTLTIGSAAPADAGSYDLLVSLACSSTVATSTPATLTVASGISAPNVSVSGTNTVCQNCTGGTATETHSGGGTVLGYQWGYRTVSGGSITDIPGQTAPSYVLDGADFPGLGGYFLVVKVTATCGGTLVSTEAGVSVTSGPPPGDAVAYFTVTSRSDQNVLEWVNPAGSGSVSVSIHATQGVGCPFPGDPLNPTTHLADQMGLRGQHSSFPHTGLTGGRPYCYTVFVDKGGGSFSAGRSLRGRTVEATDSVKWAFSTGVFSITPPTVGGAGVIAFSNDNVLHAMARGPLGGEWPSGWLPAPLGGVVQGRSPMVPITAGTATPVAYLGAQDGSVYAIDGARGGAALTPWVTPIASVVQAAPAGIFSIFNSGGLDYVLVGTRVTGGDNALVALDPFTGAELARFDNGGGGIGVVNAMAAVDYGPPARVYFTSWERSAGANTLWCLDLGPAPGVFTFNWARPLGDITSSPVLRGGRVYVGTDSSTLFSIDAASGNQLLDRSLPLGDGPVKGFVFPDRSSNDLYLATQNSVWGVVDAAGGMANKFAGPISLGGGVKPSPALFVPGSHHVYVGGNDGRLYEIDVAGPTPSLRSIALGDGLSTVGAPSLDVFYGLIHIGTEAGVFYAVETPLP
jgi:hypothetical protein